MIARQFVGVALLLALPGCSREAFVRRAQNVQDGAASGYAVQQAMRRNDEIWAQGGGGGSSPIIRRPPDPEKVDADKSEPPAPKAAIPTFIYVPAAQ